MRAVLSVNSTQGTMPYLRFNQQSLAGCEETIMCISSQ